MRTTALRESFKFLGQNRSWKASVLTVATKLESCLFSSLHKFWSTRNALAEAKARESIGKRLCTSLLLLFMCKLLLRSCCIGPISIVRTLPHEGTHLDWRLLRRIFGCSSLEWACRLALFSSIVADCDRQFAKIRHIYLCRQRSQFRVLTFGLTTFVRNHICALIVFAEIYICKLNVPPSINQFVVKSYHLFNRTFTPDDVGATRFLITISRMIILIRF